jgi:phage terminase small subunit
MKRRRGQLTERERKYAAARGEGKDKMASALVAGYSAEVARSAAHRIEQRPLVQMAIEERRTQVQAWLELDGCGLPLFSQSMKRGLREGNPATQRLWLEIFEIIGPEKMRVLIQTMNERIEDAVKRSATIFVEFVPNDRRAEFDQKVAEPRGQATTIAAKGDGE